jgi:ribose-phosphate pyrophosphokinase
MIKINYKVYDEKRYPNAELMIANIEEINFTENTIRVFYNSDKDLFNMFMITKYLRDYNPDMKINLFMPYVPYSRMDRRQESYGFSLKYVCDLINSLNFNRVDILEPHSSMTTALLNNCYHADSSVALFKHIFKEIYYNGYVMFPDAGAEKRYSGEFKEYDILVGNKKRDFKTGEILGLDIVGDEDLKGREVVIIDDLSSRGGTFYYSALALKKINAGNILLIVTHCENTVTYGELVKDTSPIEHIYTTDSIYTSICDKITVYKCERMVANGLLFKR